MSEEIVISTCETCSGDGTVGAENEICSECLGTGALPLKGQIQVLKKSITKVDELEVKIDAIIAEQALLRVDLTAGLLKIWDKVKDL